MNEIMQNMSGMSSMTEQVIATDFFQLRPELKTLQKR